MKKTLVASVIALSLVIPSNAYAAQDKVKIHSEYLGESINISGVEFTYHGGFYEASCNLEGLEGTVIEGDGWTATLIKHGNGNGKDSKHATDNYWIGNVQKEQPVIEEPSQDEEQPSQEIEQPAIEENEPSQEIEQPSQEEGKAGYTFESGKWYILDDDESTIFYCYDGGTITEPGDFIRVGGGKMVRVTEDGGLDNDWDNGTTYRTVKEYIEEEATETEETEEPVIEEEGATENEPSVEEGSEVSPVQEMDDEGTEEEEIQQPVIDLPVIDVPVIEQIEENITIDDEINPIEEEQEIIIDDEYTDIEEETVEEATVEKKETVVKEKAGVERTTCDIQEAYGKISGVKTGICSCWIIDLFTLLCALCLLILFVIKRNKEEEEE